MPREDGQAVVESVGMILIVSLAFGAMLTVVPALDGRSLGGLLAHRLVCAVQGSCDDGAAEIEKAYGHRDAVLVRRHLPGLLYEGGEGQVPVDWRECRDVGCATAPDDRDLDVHRTSAGHRVTVFTRLLRQQGRRYVQYWFYYPDSNTTFANSDRIWKQNRLLQLGGLVLRGSTTYPGYHRDDWEGASVRVRDDGEAPDIRVTSHGHWQWCKWSRCRGRWGPSSGWARVSRGSHAGHVPVGVGARERTTTPDGIRLVPFETLDRAAYRRLDRHIAPPWHKDVYRHPESPES